MSAPVAVVCCVHHKPWLVMSTLTTALAQDYQNFDLFFVYNVGAGDAARPDAPRRNTQLSAFDERVREACAVRRPDVFHVEYENDEALDSGAWYKFIRDGRWKSYDWVLFVGEGTLLARPALLSSMLGLAASEPDVHVIASGHEKRRIPKDQFLKYRERHDNPTEMDRLEDRMIGEAFSVFSRDPQFAALFQAWPSDFAPETQNHVPAGGPPSARLRQFRKRWERIFGAPSGGSTLAQLPYAIERRRAEMAATAPAAPGPPVEVAPIFINGAPTAPERVVDVRRFNGVGFHRETGIEWFGCATNHLMSRTFLERFAAKLDAYGIWDVLDLRFAGTPLEVIWGFVPAWLGFEKWFTDGFHRVRKDFVTYRREDYPVEMATYINRYYRGHLAAGWRGDFLRITALRSGLERLREQLPALYF